MWKLWYSLTIISNSFMWGALDVLGIRSLIHRTRCVLSTLYSVPLDLTCSRLLHVLRDQAGQVLVSWFIVVHFNLLQFLLNFFSVLLGEEVHWLVISMYLVHPFNPIIGFTNPFLLFCCATHITTDVPCCGYHGFPCWSWGIICWGDLGYFCYQ